MRCPPTLVVLRVLGLGDLLAGVPALVALAEAFPQHHRVLAAPAGLATAAGWTGSVHELAPTAPLAPLAVHLHGADVAVNLHGAGPQSTRVLLDADPRRLIAFEHGDGPTWDEEEHERNRWCRLLAEAGIPADPDRTAVSVPDGPVPPGTEGATLVHPGAARPAVRWAPERFAAVAAAEARAGRRVLVTGDAGEEALARSVAELAALPPSAVLAGRTDLDELARLLACAGRLVSSDTGVAHLAVALGTPSVTIYGPVSPAIWGPPPDRPRHRVVWSGVTGDPHAAVPDPGLSRVRVEHVLTELARLSILTPPPGPVG